MSVPLSVLGSFGLNPVIAVYAASVSVSSGTNWLPARSPQIWSMCAKPASTQSPYLSLASIANGRPWPQCASGGAVCIPVRYFAYTRVFGSWRAGFLPSLYSTIEAPFDWMAARRMQSILSRDPTERGATLPAKEQLPHFGLIPCRGGGVYLKITVTRWKPRDRIRP